jgi:hypothetical protein
VNQYSDGSPNGGPNGGPNPFASILLGNPLRNPVRNPLRNPFGTTHPWKKCMTCNQWKFECCCEFFASVCTDPKVSSAVTKKLRKTETGRKVIDMILRTYTSRTFSPGVLIASDIRAAVKLCANHPYVVDFGVYNRLQKTTLKKLYRSAVVIAHNSIVPSYDLSFGVILYAALVEYLHRQFLLGELVCLGDLWCHNDLCCLVESDPVY